MAQAGVESGCSLVVHLVDFGQRALVPLLPAVDPPREPVAVEGTAAGRCFQTVAGTPADGDGRRWWPPLIDGVERLGVLPSPLPDRLPDEVAARFRALTSLIGHLVAVKTPYGDTILRTRGAQRRTVASDLLWALLPPLTFACADLVVSAVLEPSDQVAGDAFERAAAAQCLPPEALRRIAHAILAHQHGVLQDDATLLIARWRSGDERRLFPI